MGALKDRMQHELTTAMKTGDRNRSSTLRMLLAAVTNAEKSGRAAHELSDDDVVGVLGTESKKRREAAMAFEGAGRTEMAEKERAEAAVIADYLPAQMSAEEISALVAQTIEDLAVGGEGMRAMGRVMGSISPRVKGRADGAAVAAEVRSQLG